MTNKRKYLVVLTLLLGTFSMFLNTTLLTTAYPSFMREFSITADYVQWLTTGFLLVEAVTIPIAGWLLQQFNAKHLYLISLIIFFIGTGICFIAPGFFVLLLGRFVQAVGVGMAMPLFQTIILYLFPKNKRGSMMGIAGIIISLAPAIGPSLSGFILVKFSWHMLFLMILPLVAIVIVLAFFFMEGVLPIKRSKLDFISLIECSIGLGLLLYGFSLFSSKNVNKWIILFSILVGVVFIIVFLLRQKKLPNPFLHLEPLGNKGFRLSVILLAVSYMALISFELVIPMYIQNVRHYSPLISGLSLLPGAVLLGIMNPISGKIFDKYGARDLCIVGMSLLSAFTFPFIFIKEDISMVLIIICYAFRLLGVSMVMMPVTTYGMNELPNIRLSDGSVINNTIKQISGSLGTALMISIMTMTTTLTNEHSKKTPLLDGYRASFATAFIFCLIALILTFKIPKDKTISPAKTPVKKATSLPKKAS